MGIRALALALVVLAAVAAGGSAAAATGQAADEPLQAQEWWLADLGIDPATAPGPGVPITIVDSGVDVTQPEFAGRPDTTYLNAQTTAGGEEFHGTAVASVAAAPINGQGLAGIYPTAALQIYDASPTSAGITDFTAAAGILAAAAHCPGVINLSFGGTSPDPLIEDAVLTAFHNGCLIVASAGNDGQIGNPQTFPAEYPHVLTVAATDENDQVAAFSTRASANDVAAPGVDITAAVPLTNDPTGYSSVDGTSFSAPIVSAVAAWVWTLRPTLTVTQLFQLLRSTARDIGPPGYDSTSGYGIVDLAAALAAAAPPADPDEPNDSIQEVKPGSLFSTGAPPLTTALRPSIRIAATIDSAEDPTDIYRVWVPAGRTIHVSAASTGEAAARIWGPKTASLDEGVAARRRDLKGTSFTAGKTGVAAYVEVILTGRTRSASYVLNVKASKH